MTLLNKSPQLFQSPEQESVQEIAPNSPLAHLLRPHSLENVAGQTHLIGPEGPLLNWFQNKKIYSTIFWGPPGCGKTTLAQILAKNTKSHFIFLNAVTAKTADIQKVKLEAKSMQTLNKKNRFIFR